MKRISLLILVIICLQFTNVLFAEGLQTLAVLDFQNNTGKTSLDYLSAGIPQMLVTELSANSRIKVVERQRLQKALKELELEQTGLVGGESAQEIGKMLGAELMIMGSFIKIGNNFRIDAHMVQVETGSVIGEKVMGSSVDDIMRLVSELSTKIYSRVLTDRTEDGGESQVLQTGSLAISSNPEKVQVFLNNVSMGNTPVSLQGVKVGTHVVSMFVNGYYHNEQKVQVKPNQIEVVTANMKVIEAGKSGTLAISTKPGDALVVLDNLPLGSSPLTLNSLPIGEHTIKLSKDGYNPWETKIALQPDKIATINMNLSLQGDLGSLVVISEPQGARVFLNGFLKGVTPITLPQLYVGEYGLKLALKDYMGVDKKISIKKDEVASISYKLEYASDEGQARMRMLTSKLSRLDYIVFGISGNKWGEFYEPSSVDVDEEGNIYVADWLNHRIQKFNVKGAFISNIGAKRNDFNLADAGIITSKKYEAGTYYKPEDIAIAPNGDVFVCDSLNNQIQRFSKDNEFILSWGPKKTSQLGYYTGRLYEPRGIGIDKLGNVYVADYGHYRIQKFTNEGRHLLTIGGKKTKNRRQFKYPVDVAVDLKMNIWAVDQGLHQVFKFDQEGNLLLTLGKKKPSRKERTMHGNFYEPNGIATDLVGNIYVADCKNNRIQIFDNDGKFTGSLGIDADNNKNTYLDYGYDPKQFRYPMGVAVDIAGNVYVADRKNERIHRFPPSLIKKP